MEKWINHGIAFIFLCFALGAISFGVLPSIIGLSNPDPYNDFSFSYYLLRFMFIMIGIMIICIMIARNKILRLKQTTPGLS